MRKTVAVVIPTFERPDFLEGAIETALGQTYEDIEVVVVDDGSSERYAEEIVAEFPETVRCIRHKKNKGLSAARNTGVHESESKYIAFLDDDDRWHREKISRQVDTLDRDDTAGIATCLVAAITPDNELIHCEQSAPSGDCSDSIVISNHIGTPSRVLVRRDAFENIDGFDESLPTKQDWDFYIRICQQWTIASVPDPLCFRTVHQSMSSSTNALKRDKQAVLNKHEQMIRERGLWRQAGVSVAAEVARMHLGKGNLKEARSYAYQACTILSFRNIALYVLSYTHPRLINNAINLKRILSRRLTECNQKSISLSEVPGLAE